MCFHVIGRSSPRKCIHTITPMSVCVCSSMYATLNPIFSQNGVVFYILFISIKCFSVFFFSVLASILYSLNDVHLMRARLTIE